MKTSFIIPLLFVFSITSAKSQDLNRTIPDSVRIFLETSLRIIKENSINRDSVDWISLKNEVLVRTRNAKSYDSAATVFPFIFQSINDHHGALKIGKRSYYWSKPYSYNNSVVLEGVKKYPKILATILDNHIGYIRIPGNNDFSGANIDADATEIRKAIDSISTRKIRGWIIDVRINTGGSMYQMLAGLAPILGEGKIGSFINQHGKNDGEWLIKQGNIYLDSNKVSKLRPIVKVNKKLPVIVLTSGMTASSGEVVAISFIGRPKTLLMGENTAGYTTANEGFKVNDLAGLNLAVDYDADRNGKIYTTHITPDKIITGGDDFESLNSDNKIAAAKNWLKMNR